MISAKKVRDRAWHYISPDVAAAAGMTFQQMQQFIAGTFTPTDTQLRDLARRMYLDVEETR